jgi:hypothetical protein
MYQGVQSHDRLVVFNNIQVLAKAEAHSQPGVRPKCSCSATAVQNTGIGLGEQDTGRISLGVAHDCKLLDDGVVLGIVLETAAGIDRARNEKTGAKRNDIDFHDGPSCPADWVWSSYSQRRATQRRSKWRDHRDAG